MAIGADSGHSPAAVRARVLAALREPLAVFSLPPGELDLTLRLLRRARLLGRLAQQVQSSGLLSDQPRVVADQLESAMVRVEARQRAARWELERLAWALRELPEVPLVVMKGCAYLLAGTPNARGREFADVDLLVPEASLPVVEARLKERGWAFDELTPYDEKYYRLWTHELPPMTHVEREVEVDLHHNLLMRTARLKPSAELLLADARPVPGFRFKVLAPVDMVLHAMVHLFYGGEMDDALRELVDIDELLRHFAATEPGFWEQFWPRAAALDLARPAFYGLRYAHQLLGSPVPEAVLAASRAGAPAWPALWVMDRLVPLALFPQHPDSQSLRKASARQALYVRSHWVKMPPGMLVRHLSHKYLARRLPTAEGQLPTVR